MPDSLQGSLTEDILAEPVGLKSNGSQAQMLVRTKRRLAQLALPDSAQDSSVESSEDLLPGKLELGDQAACGQEEWAVATQANRGYANLTKYTICELMLKYSTCMCEDILRRGTCCLCKVPHSG